MGNLVWIASYPKSGTTWLRAFLHNFLRDPDAPYDINSLMDLTAGESGARLYQRLSPGPASRYSVEDVQAMRPIVHRALTALSANLVFVKTHNAALSVCGVPLVTPEVTAGAFYIVRDPRDVTVSYALYRGRSIDDTIDFMADPEAAIGGDDRTVFQLLSTWSGHVASWTACADPRTTILRYEDMQARPEQTFGAVIRVLGLDPPPARLARAIAFSSFEQLAAQERARGFIERLGAEPAFFRAGRAGGWRAILTPAQRIRIERAHAAQMQRFGYL